MRTRIIAIIAFALLVPPSLHAQKKRVKFAPKSKAVVETPVENPRITEMRDATQQIIFIDSVVVDKADFLSVMRINTETGKLTSYDRFFNSEGHTDGYVFLNEMENKCYFSKQDKDSLMQIFTSDKLGSEWSSPEPLNGIEESITEANYPFMMTDGITLYFAAKGEESIGGYDIFVTRYDAIGSRFLKPENIGMPFNSEANDYMYVIDEISQIGYFVTDRRQPQGKVCVYTFIPTTSRKPYNQDKYTSEQIRNFADISSIAKTWGNGKERKAALARVKDIQTSAIHLGTKPAINFIINDNITYTSETQFRDPDDIMLYKELKNTQKRLTDIREKLEKSRAYFSKANASEKDALSSEIIEAEQQELQLSAEIRQLTKLIRKNENKIINHK
jgi:hypothetical protein